MSLELNHLDLTKIALYPMSYGDKEDSHPTSRPSYPGDELSVAITRLGSSLTLVNE